jgi:SAM-dependent methyltransferase
VPIGEDPYETLLRGNCIGMHATVMYRRDLLEEAGGFDPGLPACEDYELYLRLARRHPVASGGERIAEYRRHAGGMSRDAPLMLRTVLAVLRRQKPFVKGNARLEAAYRAGIRGWKDHYARQEISRFGMVLRPSGFERRQVLDLARIVRLAPATSMKLALPRSRKWLRSRIPRATGGGVDLGDLRRTSPTSRVFGYDRGTPVDRRYIEEFLGRHAEDVRGRVLEIGDNAYSRRFGGERVTRSDVLHVVEGNPNATIVGDLADGRSLPSDAFDCIVLTQTLHLVFELRDAAATLHRILKPGGVLLLTVPGVSSVDRGDWGSTWYWSFTEASLGRLLEERFPRSGLMLTTYGNVLTAIAFLHGLAQEELRPEAFGKADPQYPVIVAARAVKEEPHHASAAEA